MAVGVAPYRQSFGEEPWEPVECHVPARVRDDEYWFEDDYDIRVSADLNDHNIFLYYDRPERKWKCTCRKFVDKGTCFHAARMKGEHTVIPDARYL